LFYLAEQIMPQLRPIENPTTLQTGPQFTPPEVHAMQRAMLQLGQRWELTDEQLSIVLGNISVRTLQRWKHGQYGRPGVDVCARMSNLLGIHKALRLLFKETVRGFGWIKRPNRVFGGQTALDIMLGGQLTDLMRVRRYLDTVRAPW
jgi:hypothetical protein